MPFTYRIYGVQPSGMLCKVGSATRDGLYRIEWSSGVNWASLKQMLIMSQEELEAFTDAGIKEMPKDMWDVQVYAHKRAEPEIGKGFIAFRGARLDRELKIILIARVVELDVLAQCLPVMTGFHKYGDGKIDSTWKRCPVEGCGIMKSPDTGPLCDKHWNDIPVRMRQKYWVAMEERPTVLVSLVKKYIKGLVLEDDEKRPEDCTCTTSDCLQLLGGDFCDCSCPVCPKAQGPYVFNEEGEQLFCATCGQAQYIIKGSRVCPKGHVDAGSVKKVPQMEDPAKMVEPPKKGRKGRELC